MENKEYWVNRSEQNILNAEEMALDMSKRLKKEYIRATKAIEKEINAFYGKYAVDNKISIEDSRKRLNNAERKSFMQLLKELEEVAKREGCSKEYREYITRLRKMAYIQRLEELRVNILREVERLYVGESNEFKEQLGEAYTETFSKTMYNIEQGLGVGISFAMPNTRAVEKAVATKWLGENYSDRIWTDKARLVQALERTIGQGFALGHNPRKVAGEIKAITGTRYNSCVRLARTEMNHIANDASYDAMRDTGLVDEYEYLATLDNRTSQICRDMDGKVVNMKDKQVGINFPSLHPNCRSTTVPYFPDEDVVQERIAKDSTGKYYKIENMSYREWEKTKR